MKTHDILRAVLESPRDIAIFALDREYRYLAFNEAHQRTMKAIWNVDIAIGQSMLDFIGREDDRQKAKTNFDRALAGEHFVTVEEYGEQARSRLYYEDTYSPIRAEDGTVVGLTLFLSDVTQKKRNEDELEKYRQKLELVVDERTVALRRSEALYRSLVENAPVAVFLHRRGKLLFVNPAAVTLCNEMSASSLGERCIDDLVGSELGERLGRSEVTLRRKGGGVSSVEWTSIAVDLDGGPALLSLAVDVTTRREAEAERRRLEEQLRHTQKLESLGLLAGGIAHDFNNLLVGIMGNADLALRSVLKTRREHADDWEEVALLVQRVKTAALRASELTGQMLAYSGKGRFVVRPLDISNVAREMSELVNVSVPKSAKLELDLGRDLPVVEADSAQIRQIVMNLITNAADAVGETEGTIRLRTFLVTANRELLASSVVDDALAPGRYVCLEVHDTGCGMDQETRAKLFDPFFTTKAKGRGLGLAAVLGIVRAHHGAITVESAPGAGSTFRVFLPASEAAPTAEAALAADEDWRATGTILVADDEPRVRQVLAMMLTNIGFEVLEAGTAPACLALYRQHADSINAIMVDLMMPGGGGREVVRVLRAEGRRGPIVVSSGYTEEAIEPELRADPHLAFLEKPFEYLTFVQTLKNVLRAP
jgi:PAS domain S-box-containing protein